MPRTEAPRAAALSHLRPADAKGLRVVALALAVTAAGVWLSVSGGWLRWAAGQILLAGSLVHWFVILHECGHDTLFRTRRLHQLTGHLAAFFSLIPFHCWTRVHGRHHKWTGWQDLDPTTESLVPRPLSGAERALVNICWRLWLPLFSVVYRVNNYWHIPRLFRLFPGTADRRRVIRDAAGLVAAYAIVGFFLGPTLLLRVAGAAVVLSLIAEDLLLLSQHTHVPQHVSGGQTVRPFPTIEQEAFTRSLRLPAFASTLVLHFDAHELHHMYPFVPGYHLRQIDYEPENEIGWWQWIARAKQLRGDVLLFQNRVTSGWDI
jgi:omega-6 fatty acid desaturase (delta-12 desaturase)